MRVQIIITETLKDMEENKIMEVEISFKKTMTD